MASCGAWCSSSGCTLALRVVAVQRVGERLHRLAIGEEGLVARPAVEQRQHDVARRAAPLDDLQVLAERHQLLEPRLELGAGDLAPVGQASTRDSTARLISHFSSARSSRMKNSLRPRLARKSGGCAM